MTSTNLFAKLCVRDCGHQDCACRSALRNHILKADMHRGIGAADMVSPQPEGWPDYFNIHIKDQK